MMMSDLSIVMRFGDKVSVCLDVLCWIYVLIRKYVYLIVFMPRALVYSVGTIGMPESSRGQIPLCM